MKYLCEEGIINLSLKEKKDCKISKEDSIQGRISLCLQSMQIEASFNVKIIFWGGSCTEVSKIYLDGPKNPFESYKNEPEPVELVKL